MNKVEWTDQNKCSSTYNEDTKENSTNMGRGEVSENFGKGKLIRRVVEEAKEVEWANQHEWECKQRIPKIILTRKPWKRKMKENNQNTSYNKIR